MLLRVLGRAVVSLGAWPEHPRALTLVQPRDWTSSPHVPSLDTRPPFAFGGPTARG